MRINFKKISALGTSFLLGLTTLGFAAAANYPAPFIQGSTADVAVVVGEGALGLDYVYATNLYSDLQARARGGSDGTPVSVEGEAASLNAGSDLLYLNDELNENVDSVSSDDLPSILMDGTFTDDDGTDYEYEQTIAITSGATFAFGNSGSDLDNPALMINLPTSTAAPIYNSTITFNKAVNFSDTDSEGESLMLFGKSYTVGTATDTDTLVLLGGSDTETVNIGETKSLQTGDETLEVTLNGISDATTPVASITVNGETKTFTEGQTKTFAGGDVDVFVKTVFRTGENVGHIEVQVGADKLTLENADSVKIGADDDDVDGTLVYITGGVTAMTKLVVAVAATDNDLDHLLVGEEFMDPVFGSFNVKFQSVENGPALEGRVDTSSDRGMLSIEVGGNRELLIEATDANGNTKQIPFTYQNVTQDDNSKAVELVEGDALSEDEYTILNSGNNHYFIQVTRLNALDTLTGDVAFKDLFTGETYSLDDKDFTSGQTISLGGQTFTVTNLSSSTVKITSSDVATSLAVFPYMELVNGEDHRFAITDFVTIRDGVTDANGNITLDLPTGSATIAFTDVTNGDCNVLVTPSGGSATTIIANSTADVATGRDDTVTVGTVDYVFWVNETGADDSACTAVDVMVGLETTQSATGDTEWNGPALLFVEDEDKQDSTTTNKNAIIFRTSDDATYSDVITPIFTRTATGYDTESFDDSDYTGYLTNFGTYILFDSSDDNQDIASLTYPDSPMFANVFVAEEGATISGGSDGQGAATFNGIYIRDSEISQASTKNIIVVGGSCVNTAAAALVGGAFCGDSWTEATQVAAGQFVIEGFMPGETTLTSKSALLVAGYNAQDTANAAEYLRTQTVDTGKKYIGTSSTSAQLQVE